MDWYSQLSPIAKPVGEPADRRRRHLYLMHKYWARKPWYLVRRCIEHYSRPGDVVLDPFCGSGVTPTEAWATGRQGIGVDLNPFAVFLATQTALAPADPERLRGLWARLEAAVAAGIIESYRLQSPCPYCGGTVYAEWTGRGPKWREEQYPVRPYCPRGCPRPGLRPLDQGEEETLAEFEASQPVQEVVERYRAYPLYYPGGGRFDKKRRQESLADIFSPRNLWALDRFRAAIAEVTGITLPGADPGRPGHEADLLYLCLTSASHLVSKLRSPRTGHWAVNGLYVPGDWIDENVWLVLGKRFRRILTAKVISGSIRGAPPPRLVRGSATDLSFLLPASVDYIFTDPPYGGSIQYGELSYLWNCLLGFTSDWEREIVVNDAQGKDLEHYGQMLGQALAQCARVLKPGHWMTVTFHNKDLRVWQQLLQEAAAVGLEPVAVGSQRPLAQAYNQNWSRPAPKTDLVIDFVHRRLPRPVEEAVPESLNDLAIAAASRLIARCGACSSQEVVDEVIGAWLRSGIWRRVADPPGILLEEVEAVLADTFKPLTAEGKRGIWIAT